MPHDPNVPGQRMTLAQAVLFHLRDTVPPLKAPARELLVSVAEEDFNLIRAAKTLPPLVEAAREALRYFDNMPGNWEAGVRERLESALLSAERAIGKEV
jgi:hypothetical protein